MVNLPCRCVRMAHVCLSVGRVARVVALELNKHHAEQV